MSAAEDIAIQVAETIQTAHINRSPSTTHDLAPSTAADTKRPVRISSSSIGSPNYEIESDVDVEAEELEDDDEIPVSLLRPVPRPAPRRPQMPPLPDLRFEQSYLASLKDTKDWRGVTFVTLRDQVFMPLVQGLTWTLLVAGWRHWNGATKFRGQTIGAKIRRWWWEVNGWGLPDTRRVKNKLGDEKVAAGIVEFYTAQSSVGGD